VGLAHPDPRKPKKDAPTFWRRERFEQWLTNPHDESPIPDDLGHAGPTRESRIHIQRDASRGVGEDGKLFETEGLEFTRGGKDRQSLSTARRLALAIASDTEIPHPQSVDTLGGERRMAVWRRSECELPKCPPKLIERIVEQRACRLILLTPACFSEGYRPTWLRESRHGVTPQLVAAAVGRPQVVSGWDYDKRQPKPTRRLAPAGSVYFLELKGEQDAIRKWTQQIWMSCVSDDAKDQPNKDQDRIDGFGLAVLGAWDGKPGEISTKGEMP
jgi:CRISPR-associated protein Cmr3